MTPWKSNFSISSLSMATLKGFPLLKTSLPKKGKKRAWQKLMTASEKTTERVQKHVWAAEEAGEKHWTAAFSLPPFAHPSGESHAISLILVCGWQRGPQLCSSPHSHGSVPPARPPHRHSAARRKRWQGGGSGGLHQGETLPVGSRQFQAIAPCSLGFCLHTHEHTHKSMQRQMTINGYDNVLFFGGGEEEGLGGYRVTCFVC